MYYSVFNVLLATFNHEKALVGAFSVITNLRMELFEALAATRLTRGNIFCIQFKQPSKEI